LFTFKFSVEIRVTTWYIIKPKIPVWVNDGGSCNERCWCILRTNIWCILRPFDIFYGHLVYFVVIWYILPALACCTKKNLATLFEIIPVGQSELVWRLLFRGRPGYPFLQLGTVLVVRAGKQNERISGLPDLTSYKIPKREKYTKFHRTIPNDHKI
jgi:hypothetical protein